MGRLLKYELKKILKKPFTLVVIFGCLAVLLFADVGLGLADCYEFAWGPDMYGSLANTPKEKLMEWMEDIENPGVVVLRGQEAIRLERERQAFLEGEWDDARLQELALQYQAAMNDPANYVEELDNLEMEMRGWTMISQGMSPEEVIDYNNSHPIYTKTLAFNYGDWQKWAGLSYFLDNEVIAPDGSTRSFEEVYPYVQAPAHYQYDKGPRSTAEYQGSLVGILALAILLAAAAPLFSEEVTSRTEPMLLAAKYGRSKLTYAKILAGLLLAGGVLLALSLLNFLLGGLLFGFTGWGNPIQLVDGLTYMPYTLNHGQFLLVLLGYQLLGLFALTGLLMLLSALLRSSLPVLFAGGLFSMLAILVASQGSDGLRQIAQSLPPANAVPMLMLSEGRGAGLGFLPLPQWVAVLVVGGVILVGSLVALVLKQRRLRNV